MRALGAALLLTSVHFGGEAKDAARRVHEILATKSESGRAGKDSALVAHLVELGPGAIPELVRVHLGEHDAEVASFDFASFERSERVTLAALARLPVDRVLVHLELRFREQPTPDTALLVLRVAGSLGQQEAVPFVIQLMTELDGPDIAAGPLRRAGVDALVKLFAAAPRGLLWLQGRAMSEIMLGVVLEAVERSSPVESIAFLSSKLGKSKPMEIKVLEILGRIAVKYPWRSNIDVPSIVRPYLLRGKPQTRQVAATLLGELHDPDSIDLLVQMLGDADARVTHAARRALGQMAGVDRGDSPAAWRRFLEDEELRWESAAHAKEVIEQGEGTRRLAAARTLAGFPLRRDEVARMLTTSLDGDSAYVSRAIKVLARLGWRGCVMDVIPYLDHGDSRVRGEALACLRALTGEKLPGRSESWRAWARG